jgi:maleylpyruvate isomerase
MGARQVLATDPAVLADLAQVRLGTALFRRALSRVPDARFAEPSLLAGWSRAHLTAHVGYNARAIARLVAWAATGVERPMYASPVARATEIAEGATQRPEALRSLCEHSAIDLDVRWRDLPDDAWSHRVVTAQGRNVPATETLWMRAREVWLHAVDLDVGLSLHEVPTQVLQRLLGDIVTTWDRRADLPMPRWALVAGAVTVGWAGAGAQDVEVRGSLPAVVGWATGRAQPGDSALLHWRGGEPRRAPRWI